MATISGIPGLWREEKNKRKTLEFGGFSAFTNISEETVAVLISINVHLMLFFTLTVNLNPCLREHACLSALTQHPSSANTQLLRQDPWWRPELELCLGWKFIPSSFPEIIREQKSLTTWVYRMFHIFKSHLECLSFIFNNKREKMILKNLWKGIGVCRSMKRAQRWDGDSEEGEGVITLQEVNTGYDTAFSNSWFGDKIHRRATPSAWLRQNQSPSDDGFVCPYVSVTEAQSEVAKATARWRNLNWKWG